MEVSTLTLGVGSTHHLHKGMGIGEEKHGASYPVYCLDLSGLLILFWLIDSAKFWSSYHPAPLLYLASKCQHDGLPVLSSCSLFRMLRQSTFQLSFCECLAATSDAALEVPWRKDGEIKIRIRIQKAEVKWNPLSGGEERKYSTTEAHLFMHSAGWCHMIPLCLATCLHGSLRAPRVPGEPGVSHSFGLFQVLFVV